MREKYFSDWRIAPKVAEIKKSDLRSLPTPFASGRPTPARAAPIAGPCVPKQLCSLLEGCRLIVLDLVEAGGLDDLLQLVAFRVPVLCAEEQVLHLGPDVDEPGNLWFRSVNLKLLPGCLVGQGLVLHE